jgi:hypothetical protein
LAEVLVAACALAALANRHRFFVAAIIRFLPSALIWRLGLGGSTVVRAEGSDSPLIAAHRFFPERHPAPGGSGNFAFARTRFLCGGGTAQPRKLSLQGGYGGCGGLGVGLRRGNGGSLWRSGGAPASAPVSCAGAAAARGHPAQLLGSLVEQEGLSGHNVVSSHHD